MFSHIGPLNAAMANVLPAAVRGRGFAVNVLAIHLLGDAISPYFIGLASDHMGGLHGPVFGAGSLLVLAGAGACSRGAARSSATWRAAA